MCVELAVQNNIELLCLPAHTSSILQPLDVDVCKAVKGTWRKCLRSYYDESRYSNVDKQAFPTLLKRLNDSGAFSRVNAISGFESCGIYPLYREKITSDKLSTSILLTQQAETSSSNTKSTSVTPEPDHQLEISQTVAQPVRDVTEANVQSTPTNTTAAKLTPRKAIETAILSHLKQITPPNKNEKRVRVRRKLAECLTSEEVRKRMREDEERKQVASASKKMKKDAQGYAE